MADGAPVRFSQADAERARAQLALGLSFLRAREATLGMSEVTLQSSLAEGIARLDSSASDPVEALGDGDTPLYLERVTGTGLGELQRIEALRASLLGPDGLIARLRGDP